MRKDGPGEIEEQPRIRSLLHDREPRREQRTRSEQLPSSEQRAEVRWVTEVLQDPKQRLRVKDVGYPRPELIHSNKQREHPVPNHPLSSPRDLPLFAASTGLCDWHQVL